MATPTTEPAEVTPENVEEILAARGLHGPGYGLLPHAGALRDEFKASDISAIHPGNPEFDFETIFARLDGEAGVPSGNAMDNICVRRAVLKMSSLVVGLIFDWLLEVNLKDARAVKTVGVRAITAAWVINSDRFAGESLTALAKRLGYQSGSAMNPEAAEFSRRFGISNRFQNHDWRKKHESATAN